MKLKTNKISTKWPKIKIRTEVEIPTIKRIKM
jgi:hypothetical protein